MENSQFRLLLESAHNHQRGCPFPLDWHRGAVPRRATLEMWMPHLVALGVSAEEWRAARDGRGWDAGTVAGWIEDDAGSTSAEANVTVPDPVPDEAVKPVKRVNSDPVLAAIWELLPKPPRYPTNLEHPKVPSVGVDPVGPGTHLVRRRHEVQRVRARVPRFRSVHRRAAPAVRGPRRSRRVGRLRLV